MAVNDDITLESSLPVVRSFGLQTNKTANFQLGMVVNGTASFGGGAITSTTQGNKFNTVVYTHQNQAAANATATLTASQVASGYITSTSGAATTLTMPTGTLLGAGLGAVQGYSMDLYVDNTAGANPVTIAVGTNAILSDAAATTPGSFGQLTVASGPTGIGRFTITFSSPTAYVFTRTA